MKRFFLFFLLIILMGCSSKYDTFAQCLTENNATMYGTGWCSHCQNQKKAFGNSFDLINYVDCDFEGDKCDEAGVDGFPTWVINGENYPGEKQLYELALLSGCVSEFEQTL